MKKSSPLTQVSRNSFQDAPFFMEAKSTRPVPKSLKTERPTSKNSKQDLLDYFKKERGTLNIVSSHIKQTLMQSKSIDLLPQQQQQKTERLKTNYQQPIEQRIQTDDCSGQRTLKTKNLSLATIQMEKRDYGKIPLTTTQTGLSSSPQNFLSMKQSVNNSKQQSRNDAKDTYLFDMQLLRNAQSVTQEYQQYFKNTNKINKQSVQSDSVNRASFEDLLNGHKLNKGQSSTSNRKHDSDQKSTNQSQQRSDSLKKPVRTEESHHYDPKKQLQIILYYKNQKYHYLYNFQNLTTDNLYNYLIQQIACIENSFLKLGGGTGSTEGDTIQLELNKICQFQTVSKNIPVDFYLSTAGTPLSVFQGVTLQLQPLLSQVQMHKRVQLKDFILLKCIGVGGFSRVYMVRKKDNGRFYALKLIDKRFIMENQKEIIVQNERDIMAKLDNQFITPLHYAFETKYYIAFALDYCAGGELFYHLRKLRRLNEPDAKFYFVEICIGMAYLHSQNIVYRDIKPENILLDLQGHLLLSDFGLSKPEMASDDFAYSFCGSPEYMAPEMLMKTGHNYLVDCYCLGALLYELVTGLPPFYSHNTQEIYNSILTDTIQFPPYVSITPTLKDLILQLLQKDPSERLGNNGGVVEILTHPWFHDVDFEAIVNRKLMAPYRPDPLKYNFDEEEFNKGDAEFRKQFSANMQKEFQNNDPSNFVLKNFYFSREATYGNQDNGVRTNIVNVNSLQYQPPSAESSPQPQVKRIPKSIGQDLQLKRPLKNAGKSEVYDYFKRHEILTKSNHLLQQSKQQGHQYSKTMQSSLNDLRQLKQLMDQSKGQLVSDRLATLPDNQHTRITDRVKTEQFLSMASPKTTTNNSQKQSNFQKLFGSDKRKYK